LKYIKFYFIALNQISNQYEYINGNIFIQNILIKFTKTQKIITISKILYSIKITSHLKLG